MERDRRVAEVLRSTREKLAMTIEKAAADAGIPLRYVRLLEGDQPSGVGVADELYLIPYFRRYATFLGLDPLPLLPDFLADLRRVAVAPTASSTAPVFTYRRNWTWVWKPLAAGAAIALATVLISRQTPQRSAPNEEWAEPLEAQAPLEGEPVAAAATPSPAAAPAAEQTPAAIVAAAMSPGLPAPAAAPMEGPSPGAILEASAGARELRITAAEETWIAISIDENATRSLLLKPGETHTWTANSGFTLTVGNAGGITLTLDGRELPRLGGSGQVVRNLRLPSGEPPPSG